MNMRLPATSRAIPIPSIKWSKTISGCLRPRIDGCAIHGIASRRIAAIGPIKNAILEVQFQVDRLGQTVKKHFNIAAVGGILALRDVDTCAKDLPLFSVVRAFLRPVDLSAFGVHRDSNAPFLCVATGPWIALARIHQSLDLRTIEIGSHDAHPFAIRPIEFSVCLIEMESALA